MARRTTGGREPRKWLIAAHEPKFGRILDAKWRKAKQSERASLAAAQNLHEVVRQARARMSEVALNQAETAALGGINPDLLSRILNGRTYPTLYDLHCIGVAVGVPFDGGYPLRRRLPRADDAP